MTLETDPSKLPPWARDISNALASAKEAPPEQRLVMFLAASLLKRCAWPAPNLRRPARSWLMQRSVYVGSLATQALRRRMKNWIDGLPAST